MPHRTHHAYSQLQHELDSLLDCFILGFIDLRSYLKLHDQAFSRSGLTPTQVLHFIDEEWDKLVNQEHSAPSDRLRYN